MWSNWLYKYLPLWESLKFSRRTTFSDLSVFLAGEATCPKGKCRRGERGPPPTGSLRSPSSLWHRGDR